MNWDAPGAVGELIGAIAVLASIVYLASQIRHASRQLEAQIENNVSSRIFDAYAPIYEGRNVEVWYRGLTEPDQLTAMDRYLFEMLMWRHAGALGEGMQRVRSGELDARWSETMRVHYTDMLGDKPGALAWARAHPDSDLCALLAPDAAAPDAP